MNAILLTKHQELTYGIINAAFDVHNMLGCGFLEKVYENAMVHELELRKYKVERQKNITIKYKGKVVGDYISDLIIEDKVIVELKAIEEISNVHKAQLLNYLKVSGREVGLIINFAKPKLEYKRLVMERNRVNADEQQAVEKI